MSHAKEQLRILLNTPKVSKWVFFLEHLNCLSQCTSIFENR